MMASLVAAKIFSWKWWTQVEQNPDKHFRQKEDKERQKDNREEQ